MGIASNTEDFGSNKSSSKPPKIQAHYTPDPSDIILASFPKTGTTWLKALTTSILRYSPNINHSDSRNHDDPLCAGINPHQVVPFLEVETFGENPSRDISQIPSPRVFNTHLPLSLLPDDIVKTSGCRLIYITRHPADTFVSLWHMYKNRFGTEISISEAFEDFRDGFVPAGPYFEHVLEFWAASREEKTRERVLFVTYEDLQARPEENVKTMAEFLGCLKVKEDCNGEVEEIVRKCSFERLSKVEMNRGKQGAEEEEKTHWSGMKFQMFFRKGVVGDWKNHLSDGMMKKLEDMAERHWIRSQHLHLSSSVKTSTPLLLIVVTK